MKQRTLARSALMVSAGSLLLGGCVVREVRYRHAPPPPVIYQQPVYQQPVPPPVAVVPQAPQVAPPPGAPPTTYAPVVPAPGAEVVVTEAPPPPIVEVQTYSPGPEYLWLPGAWVWHGRWVWEGGRWGRRPHRGAIWYAPHYEYRRGVHVYIGGGWR